MWHGTQRVFTCFFSRDWLNIIQVSNEDSCVDNKSNDTTLSRLAYVSDPNAVAVSAGEHDRYNTVLCIVQGLYNINQVRPGTSWQQERRRQAEPPRGHGKLGRKIVVVVNRPRDGSLPFLLSLFRPFFFSTEHDKNHPPCFACPYPTHSLRSQLDDVNITGRKRLAFTYLIFDFFPETVDVDARACVLALLLCTAVVGFWI